MVTDSSNQTAPTQTALAEVALAFCRECLGWGHPVAEADGLIFKTTPGQPAWGESFGFTDLNAVMEAVRGWCEAHALWARLHYAAGYFSADVGQLGTTKVASSKVGSTPCHALLSACVEAARKLREAV